MKLIGIIYLVSFCCHLDVAPTNVASELNKLLKKFSWNWLTMGNGKFNSDDLHTPEMIKRAGYPVEVHVVTTEDGYILTLHRIPGGNNSLPVLLQHGFLSTSAIWIILGKSKALPYLLADQGYDVWLGNSRGNIYSRMHISLSSTTSTYWNFSFHEVGIYDLPAMITYITNTTSQQLHTYIGHSMGTTSFYVMAAECPEIAQMVQMMISFSPVVFIDHMTSFIRYIAFIFTDSIIMRFVFHKFLVNEYVRFWIKYFCAQNFGKEICLHALFTIWGHDWEQFNHTLLSDIVSHSIAGGSSYMLTHYYQLFQSEKFCKYDYGRAKNLLMYHSVEPPEYDLANITIPIALFYGSNDGLVDPVDVKKLFRLLPNVIDLYEVPWSDFNHVDFILAKDAPKLLYERVFTLIRGYN